MANSGVWVELTEGNIANSHIYLRDVLFFFPVDSIGGSNARLASAQTIFVEFVPGTLTETDIDGEKEFLRARGAVREFFENTGAHKGDRVFISKTDARSFRFELSKR